MSGGYVLIAGFLFYIFLLQKSGTSGYSPIRLAVIFTVGYFALSSIVMGLLYYSQSAPILPNLMNRTVLFTVIAQFITATAVFYKVDENSDDYMVYALWGGLGFALIFFIIPQFLRQLF